MSLDKLTRVWIRLLRNNLHVYGNLLEAHSDGLPLASYYSQSIDNLALSWVPVSSAVEGPERSLRYAVTVKVLNITYGRLVEIILIKIGLHVK